MEGVGLCLLEHLVFTVSLWPGNKGNLFPHYSLLTKNYYYDDDDDAANMRGRGSPVFLLGQNNAAQHPVVFLNALSFLFSALSFSSTLSFSEPQPYCCNENCS